MRFESQIIKYVFHISSPLVKAREGVLELLSAGAVGHSPQARAVPVDLPVGQDDAVAIVLDKCVERFGFARVLSCHKHRDVLPCVCVCVCRCVLIPLFLILQFLLFEPTIILSNRKLQNFRSH